MNALITIAAVGFGIAQLVFVWVVVKCMRGGPQAPDKPWEGADSLEWTLPSPAPYHSFVTPPAFK